MFLHLNKSTLTQALHADFEGLDCNFVMVATSVQLASSNKITESTSWTALTAIGWAKHMILPRTHTIGWSIVALFSNKQQQQNLQFW